MPVGPSDGWIAVGHTEISLSDQGSEVLDAAPTLPASATGTGYILTATVDVRAPSADTTGVSVTCALALGLDAAASDTVQFLVPAHNLHDQEVPASMALGARITTPTAPSVICTTNAGSDAVFAEGAQLTATAVGTVHLPPG